MRGHDFVLTHTAKNEIALTERARTTTAEAYPGGLVRIAQRGTAGGYGPDVVFLSFDQLEVILRELRQEIS